MASVKLVCTTKDFAILDWEKFARRAVTSPRSLAPFLSAIGDGLRFSLYRAAEICAEHFRYAQIASARSRPDKSQKVSNARCPPVRRSRKATWRWIASRASDCSSRNRGLYFLNLCLTPVKSSLAAGRWCVVPTFLLRHKDLIN